MTTSALFKENKHSEPELSQTNAHTLCIFKAKGSITRTKYCSPSPQTQHYLEDPCRFPTTDERSHRSRVPSTLQDSTETSTGLMHI